MLGGVYEIPQVSVSVNLPIRRKSEEARLQPAAKDES
jgi:hypothetical protein